MSEEKDTKQLHDLMAALESTTSLIQTLLLDLRANSSALGSLENQVNTIQKDLDDIEALVKGGDEPLLTKFALVGKDIQNIQTQMNDLLIKMAAQEKKTEIKEQQESKTRWHLVGYIITGLLGIISSMITYFLSQGH